jgi:hypothetical protein
MVKFVTGQTSEYHETVLQAIEAKGLKVYEQIAGVSESEVYFKLPSGKLLWIKLSIEDKTWREIEDEINEAYANGDIVDLIPTDPDPDPDPGPGPDKQV